jgi:hypothetical protein
MPVTTRDTLKSLGTKRKFTATTLTTLYRRLAITAIKRAHGMLKTRRRLEADLHHNPGAIIGCPNTHAGTPGTSALQAAKRKEREIKQLANKSKKPPD